MNIFLTPVISEKSLSRVESANEYTFQAPRQATKLGVRQAVEKLFAVKVLSVRTKVLPGKTKRAGKTRRQIKKADSKQVVVRLDKKDKIELFEIKEKNTRSAKITKSKK